MSFEIPQYSFSHAGEPPTPTKTPTSPNFFLNSFQTPKQGTRFYGPQSPWSPAFHSVTSPDLKTPTQLNFTTTPTKSPIETLGFKRPSTGRDSETEIASHVLHSSANSSLPLPPVEPSRQLSSSPNPSSPSEAKRRRLNTSESSVTPLKTCFDQFTDTATSFAGSMQTPPPTSTSASRRTAQQAQVAELINESAEKSRSMSFPNFGKGEGTHGSTSQVEESPQQFPALQFSPEVFGYPTSGPATAPVYPQHKLFWDPEQGGDTMNIDFPMDDTFTTFGIGIQKIPDPFVSTTGHANGMQFPTSPAFNLISASDEHLGTFTTSSHPESPTRTITSARGKCAGNVVNPSLLFSSPSRAADVAAMPVVSQTIEDDTLRPYAHQIRDAQIELDMQLARKPKRKRAPETGDSPAVKAALLTLREDQTGRSGIERDHIDDIIEAKAIARSRSRRSSYGYMKERKDIGSSTLQKRRSRSRLDDSQRKRSSVTLTIDASGRAKTVVADDTKRAPRSEVPVDSSPEDSESDSSSSGAEMVTSRPQSFAFPSQKHKQPKLGRFFKDPKSHSQRSSYASTLGSGGTAKVFSTQRTSSDVHTQHGSQIHNGAARNEVESEAETVIDTDDDRGDAQSELKKVLRSRSQKRASNQAIRPESRDGFTGPRRAYSSHGGALPPYRTAGSHTPGNHVYHDPYSNISPTTITDPDMSTPTTGRESNTSSDSTRCVCHITEDFGEVMIQCESCRKWQHVSCLGLDPDKLPYVHLCVFCTGSTPNVRGGRIREPVRAAFPPPSSPLAHKSHRYR